MAGCSKQRVEMPTEIKPITFTENAANKVAGIIQEEGNPNLKLRAYVEGGGCKGFQYGFTLDDVVNSDDSTYTTNNVVLVIDNESAKVLSGATIDYINDLEEERFTIDNPGAKTTCSCGNSFDIEE
jgi:iron-sulfur cluster insertion protein